MKVEKCDNFVPI